MLLLSPNLMGGQRDVTCEIMYPNWCPCLLCNFQTILGKHYSYTNQGVEINEKKFWRGPKKTGAAAVCAISHRMGRTFLCMEIPLTRGNLLEKIPGAAPQKMGADKEKLHTKKQKLIAHVSCIPNMSSSTLVPHQLGANASCHWWLPPM